MDPKSFQVQLQNEPTEDQYIFCKAMFKTLVRRANIEFKNEMDALLLSCGPTAFHLVSNCTSYDEAIQILD